MLAPLLARPRQVLGEDSAWGAVNRALEIVIQMGKTAAHDQLGILSHAQATRWLQHAPHKEGTRVEFDNGLWLRRL